MTHGTDKGDAILDAALVLFAEQGFHATIVPDIAARAGVGAGTIYRYFGSKEAIVNALYRRWKVAFAERVAPAYVVPGGPRERVLAFLDRAFDFAAAWPVALRFMETHHHAAYLDAESLAISDAVLRPAVEMFDAGRVAGLTRDAPGEVLAALVWGGFIGVLRLVWAGRVQATPQLRQATAEALWAAVRAP